MSNYTKSTNFASKDSLASGNPLKIVKGTEIDTEFNNIATAVATKADLVSPALTGTPTAPTAAGGTNTTQIATTAFVTSAVSGVSGTLGTMATQNANNVNISGGTVSSVAISGASISGGSVSGISDLAVADGGTGASTAADARTNLSAAKSGANSDITSLSGLTTALSVAQGGTGATSLTANNVLLGNGTSAPQTVAPGTSGNILTSNGTTWTSAAPPAIGSGQTWQSVTRTSGTSYTNSTGKPIVFLMSFGAGSSSSELITLTVDGVSMTFINAPLVSGVVFGQNSAVIPAGSTYSYSANTGVSKNIYELR